MTPPPDGRDPTGPDADGADGADGGSRRPDPRAGRGDPDATTWLKADAIAGGPVSAAPADPAPAVAGPVSDAEHNPSLNKLGNTLRKGAAISAIMLFVTQVIALTQTIVVARLLTPLEIGAFTLGTMFCNYLVTMAGGGMKAALIQRGEDIEDAANTAFWASLVTGVVMSTVALASAPLLGMFFRDELVALIAAVTCGTLLVHALLNVPEALMQRRFNFKRKLIVDPITSGSYAIVAIVGSIMGYGVWALVAALYASQVATLVASWTLARWRPGKGRFRYRIWREMAQFSFPLIVQGISANLRDSAQPAIVGRLLGTDPAAQYRYGKRIGILPGQAIIQIASYVLFPAFSRIADDAVRFRRGFLRALRLLWTVTLPLGILLAAIGGPAIVVLLGPEWAPAGVFVAAMAGFGPGTALNAVSVESIKGAGQSRLIHWVTGTSLVVGVGGLVLFIVLGMGLFGVGLAVSLEGLVAGALTLALARPIVGVAWGELARVMVPPLVASLTAGAAVAALEHLVLQSATHSVPVGLLFLAVDFLVFAGLYVAVMAVVAPGTIREVVDLLGKFRKRRSGGEGGAGDAAAVPAPDGPDPDDPRTRRGEDDLLDAPTIVMALWNEPETQRLVSLGPPPPRRPAPAPRPPGPPPGPRPHASTPAPAVDGPTTALAPTPQRREAAPGLPEDGRPTETMRTHGANGNGAHHGHGPNGNGPNGNGSNGNGPNGNGSNGNGSNGNGSNGDGSNGDGDDGAGGGRRPGRRRMVPMTQQPPRRPRR